MDEGGEDEEADHEDHGDVGCAEGEEADEADCGEVEADEQVHQRAGVYEAASIDGGVADVQEVVLVDQVDAVEAGGGEAEDDGRDAGVADGWWGSVLKSSRRGVQRGLPMTPILVKTGKTAPQCTGRSLCQILNSPRGLSKPFAMT